MNLPLLYSSGREFTFRPDIISQEVDQGSHPPTIHHYIHHVSHRKLTHIKTAMDFILQNQKSVNQLLPFHKWVKFQKLLNNYFLHFNALHDTLVFPK